MSTEQLTTRISPQPTNQISRDLKDVYCFDSDHFTNDYYEYEQGQKHIIVRGRLKKNIQFWRDIGANVFVLDVIENGYKLPLFSMPPQYFSDNNRSAISEYDFVCEAIIDLIDRSLVRAGPRRSEDRGHRLPKACIERRKPQRGEYEGGALHIRGGGV